MSRVLVTGATGFIGRHVIAPLVDRGYEVHATCLRHAGHARPGVEWHRTDLFDAAQSAALVESVRPTHLLHLAWYAETGKFWHAEENFQWVEASLRLIRHFRDAGGKRAVMAGSCAEYSWDHGPCSEDATPCLPETVYGVCKNALREMVASFASVGGVSTAWARIFFLYGPAEPSGRFMPSIINRLLARQETICRSGNHVRDLLHVEDVAEAFAALLESRIEGTVNIGSGAPVSLGSVASLIARKLEAVDCLQLGMAAPSATDPASVVAVNTRLVQEVGWAPKYGLEMGIEQTIQWWRDKREFIQ